MKQFSVLRSSTNLHCECLHIKSNMVFKNGGGVGVGKLKENSWIESSNILCNSFTLEEFNSVLNVSI